MASSPDNDRDPTLAEEAAALHCGYSIGFFDKRDIEHWADSKITALDIPPDALLDLSMIRETHPLDVLNLLKALGGDAIQDLNAAVQIGFVGLTFQSGNLLLQNAIGRLCSLRHTSNLSPDEVATLYSIDHCHDHAIAGEYYTLPQIEQEFCEFVRPYIDALRKRYSQLMTLHPIS